MFGDKDIVERSARLASWLVLQMAEKNQTTLLDGRLVVKMWEIGGRQYKTLSLDNGGDLLVPVINEGQYILKVQGEVIKVCPTFNEVLLFLNTFDKIIESLISVMRGEELCQT